MSIFAEQVFGIPLSSMRNKNAVIIMRQAADKLEKRIEAVQSIGTMENFWKAPIERIGPNGQLTREPFDPTAGIPYQSVNPIRLDISDVRYEGPDAIEPRLKKAFIVYCDNAKKNGTELPKFNRRIDKLKFNVRHTLTRLGII